MIHRPDRNEQDALLVAGGQQKLQNVEDSFNACSSTAGILLQESSSEKISNEQNGVSSHYGHSVQQQPDNSDDDAPPPYVEQASTSSGRTNRPQENGVPSTESSFASKFKAFTSHFVSKPHPLASALCQAVTNGDAQQVSGLLNQGAKVDGRNGDGKTPLQCAIATDNEYLFHILLAAGASPKGQGWSGSRLPPLFQAANDGKLRIAQSLLERGADIAEANLIGQPYFCEVCRLGNVQGVEFLLKNGANAKTQNIAGRPVLVTAVINGNLELTSLLLKFGADANCTDVTGSPVAVNAIEKKGIAMMSLLLDHGADPNATNVFGNHLLSAAISASRPDVARLLLDRGAKGRIYYVSGEPVFISVIKHAKLSIDDKEDLLERLLNKGAKASESDNWGIPALRYVLESSSSTQKMLELLLRNGAKPNDVEMAEGSTPLLYAMDKGKREETKLLLQYGADVNATDEQKRLPLMQAVVKGDVEMAKMMKSQGARIDEQGLVSVASVARLLNRQDMMDAIGLKAE